MLTTKFLAILGVRIPASFSLASRGFSLPDSEFSVGVGTIGVVATLVGLPASYRMGYRFSS
jgi:hypothetical protein